MLAHTWGMGKILEAEPGGSRYNTIDAYPDAIWSSDRIPLTDAQRIKIIADALNFLGIPYGFLDIVAIALAQSRLGSETRPPKALLTSAEMVGQKDNEHAYLHMLPTR